MFARSLGSKILVSTIALVLVSTANGENLTWRGMSFTVPDGFKTRDWNYVEGVVTTLTYQDGSQIILQQGGMMRKPILQKGHDVTYSSETEEKIVRGGRDTGTSTYWREEDFKLQKRGHHRVRVFLPSIAYDHVSKSRKAEFDASLSSFSRAMRSPK